LYADNHPLTLNLDIDDVWAMISSWRKQKELTAPLAKKISLEMARVHLLAGHEVIIPQILQTTELADGFQQLAFDCSAEYYEVLLSAPKEEAVNRFIERSKNQGHPTGYREGSTIATEGREDKLRQMYDNMIGVADIRPHVIRIVPVVGDVGSTYKELLSKIS
jgi:hypothetical protein